MKSTRLSNSFTSFDFDVQKMYLLFRNDKNTNHPSLSVDTGSTIDFADAFKGKWTTAK